MKNKIIELLNKQGELLFTDLECFVSSFDTEATGEEGSCVVPSSNSSRHVHWANVSTEGVIALMDLLDSGIISFQPCCPSVYHPSIMAIDPSSLGYIWSPVKIVKVSQQ